MNGRAYAGRSVDQGGQYFRCCPPLENVRDVLLMSRYSDHVEITFLAGAEILSKAFLGKYIGPIETSYGSIRSAFKQFGYELTEGRCEICELMEPSDV